MEVRISDSKRFTVTTEQDVFSPPDPYIAFLRRLEITNESTALATVTIRFYNETASKIVLTKSVAAGETIVLLANELPIEAFPTKMTIISTQQPYSVDYSVELE